MKYGSVIAATSAALLFSASGAFAAGAVPAAPPAGATTVIDMGGQVVTSEVAGGLSDPVPLFANSSGPVLFVIDPASLAGTGDQISAVEPGQRQTPQPPTLTTSHIGRR